MKLRILKKILKKSQLKFIGKDQRGNEKERKILKYREFDTYEVDIVVSPPVKVHVPKLLPSEPPEGITYIFGPSGYIIEGKNTDYCTIHTEWRNVNNYCHWTYSELPLMCLALESDAKLIVFPDVLLNGTLPFQMRWLEVLKKTFPDKRFLALSENLDLLDGIIPINHDTTSTSNVMIGKCEYTWYHRSRATPYCIEVLGRLKRHFISSNNYLNAKAKVYINRKTRRLKNENEIQEYLISEGFSIVNLEELTLDEQINLFSNASEIIGFHGAGLANIIFCNSSTKIVEIVDADCVYPSYIDGLVIRGRKATRTHFHMVAHMKSLNYSVLESNDYLLNVEKVRELLHSTGYNNLS